MSSEHGEDEVDAIVGAALKAMVESGVSRARLGAFAVSFRDEVTQILGRKATKPEEPDLLQVVTQAVRQVMAEGIAPVQTKPRAEKAKRVYVRVNGVATSVTLPAEPLRNLEKAAGGPKKAKAIIQQLAATAPEGVANRSGWVQERMLALAEVQPTPDARH